MKFSNIFRIYIHYGETGDKIYEVCYKSHIRRRYTDFYLPQTARRFIVCGHHRVVKDSKNRPVRFENSDETNI